MAENEKKSQEIPVMYGNFRVYGKVEKLNKKDFNSMTKTNREKRSLTLGLRTSKDNLIFISMSAVAQNDVYFVKRDPETKKTVDTKIIPWADRLTNNLSEEYVPMSNVSVGVVQEEKVNENGATVLENNTVIRVMFDALQEIYDHVEIGDDLFIRGSVSVESYYKNSGEKRNVVRLTPSQISKRKQLDPLNFDAADFVEQNVLTQTIIPQSIEFDDDQTRAIINGLVIGNKKEGMIEIEIDKDAIGFAKKMQKEIEETPYLSLTVNTRIINEGNVSQQEKVWDEDFQTWVKAPRKAQSSGTKYQYDSVVVSNGGTVEDALDKTTYTEENINEFRNTFLRGQQEFGSNNATTQGSEDLWGNI